jgi:hypothetical protein
MMAAARVTSRRVNTGQMFPGAAVRDVSREDGWRAAAARAGGDVDSPD